jgi:hypothetical protein
VVHALFLVCCRFRSSLKLANLSLQIPVDILQPGFALIDGPQALGEAFYLNLQLRPIQIGRFESLVLLKEHRL